MYIAVVENFHISALRMPCFERLESMIMGESGINAYTLQPFAHHAKLFSLEMRDENAPGFELAENKEFRVVEKIECPFPAPAGLQWLLGAAEFMSSFKDGSHAHLFGFYVVPEVRGAGLAAIMLGVCERELAASCGVKSIDLSVSEENTRAVAFYKKNGYLPRETAKDFYGAGNHRLIMKKEL